MGTTVEMSASALRYIMGEALDGEAYENGRRDARKFFKEHPDQRESKIEEVKRIIRNGCLHEPSGPSYWIGCMTEAEFNWR